MELNEFLDSSNEVELDVQKAVVEALAADKAEQDEQINKLKSEIAKLQSKLSEITEQLNSTKQELAHSVEVFANNADTTCSNKVAILERDPEINDRFEGETREHLLEVIQEAREQAEKDGRLRRAQLLESVLLNNESTGKLTAKREELQRLFNENANIISGPVIDELNKLGIAYKHGDDYLLTSEILNRNY